MLGFPRKWSLDSHFADAHPSCCKCLQASSSSWTPTAHSLRPFSILTLDARPALSMAALLLPFLIKTPSLNTQHDGLDIHPCAMKPPRSLLGLRFYSTILVSFLDTSPGHSYPTRGEMERFGASLADLQIIDVGARSFQEPPSPAVLIKSADLGFEGCVLLERLLYHIRRSARPGSISRLSMFELSPRRWMDVFLSTNLDLKGQTLVRFALSRVEDPSAPAMNSLETNLTKVPLKYVRLESRYTLKKTVTESLESDLRSAGSGIHIRMRVTRVDGHPFSFDDNNSRAGSAP